MKYRSSCLSCSCLLLVFIVLLVQVSSQQLRKTDERRRTSTRTITTAQYGETSVTTNDKEERSYHTSRLLQQQQQQQRQRHRRQRQRRRRRKGSNSDLTSLLILRSNSTNTTDTSEIFTGSASPSIDFVVVNTLTDDEIITLSEDDASTNVIDLEAYNLTDPSILSIVAVPDGYAVPVSGILFTLDDGSIWNRTEWVPPFALCGNWRNDYFSCPGLDVGKHTLQALVNPRFGAPYDTEKEIHTIEFEIKTSTTIIVGVGSTVGTPTATPIASLNTPAPVSDVVPPPFLVPTSDTLPTPAPTTAPASEPSPAPQHLPTPEPVQLSTALIVDPIPTSDTTIVFTTLAPIDEPTASPVNDPTPSPIIPPTPAPINSPTPAPINAPTLDPVNPPTPTPVNPPPPPPVNPPTPPPTPAPINPPTPPVSEPVQEKCIIPKLVGDWQIWEPAYPIAIAESLGALVGDDFVIVSGYTEYWTNVTKQVFAYNVKEGPTAVWREQDSVPVAIGFSHAAFAVNGQTMYICGGYLGASPGPHTATCLKYEHTNEPGYQWSFLPSLPEGRGGGGLFYMKLTNSLLFATGATRPDGIATDHDDAWELKLDNLEAGWRTLPKILYIGNHISHVTATYQGRERHFMLAGQREQNEVSGNLDDVVEWDNIQRVWFRRQSLPFKRGHASTSTFSYSCGFIIAGGAMNGGDQHTADISYYDIETDSWTSIGNLPRALNTPACDIVQLPDGDWIYCQGGPITGSFSWRIRISDD